MQERQPTQWTRLRSRCILQFRCYLFLSRRNLPIPYRDNEEESETEETGTHQHLLRANHQAETCQRPDYLPAGQTQ